jgi:uncharacterized RDD family membrane protein YckC
MKQSVGGNVHAEINSPDAGMLLTDNELVYINVSGMQRARLTEIAKVARENGELVISSSERPLIRGAIKADKEALSNFFSQVRQVAAWSRERRTVILDNPSDIPMDSSFIGRAPDAPIHQQMPDPIAQMPVAPPPPRPMVTVSQSLGSETQNPFLPPPPRGELGRGAPTPVRNEDLIAQDRPRVSASTVKFSESRNEPVRLEYAGFGARFLAWLIDYIVLSIASGIITNLFIGNSLNGLSQLSSNGQTDSNTAVVENLSGFGTGAIIATLAVTLLTWLYYAFLESGERQGTLGKMAMGIVVTAENQQRLSFGHASWRYFAKSLVPLVVAVLCLLALIPAVAALNNDNSVNNLLPSDGILNLLGSLMVIVSLGSLMIVLSYLAAAFTAKKQAVHDMVAKTLVLKK